MNAKELQAAQQRAVFEDRIGELRAELEALPPGQNWRRKPLLEMINQEYVRAGFREDLIFNGSMLVNKPKE